MLKKFFLALSSILIMVGCVSGPRPVESNDAQKEENVNQAPPDWVLSRPVDDDKYKYFTGSGTSNSGDEAEARNIAGGDLYADIQRFIGVDVESVTEATAKGSLDSFKTDITQVVTQTGSARVIGFEIIEFWTDNRREPAVTVHVLGRYDKNELMAEKERQEKIRDEALKAITGPEAAGQQHMAAGRYYEAALEFITAAGSALESDVANAAIKYKRNIDQAMDAIEHINLVKLNDNLTALIGQQFPEPLRLKVISGGSPSDPGVPRVKLSVSYRIFHKPSGKMRPASAEVITDEDGLGIFTHPVPEFVGKSNIRITLDLRSKMESLEKAVGLQKDLRDGLEMLINNKSVVFVVTVDSNAKNIKTGVVMIDYDSEGNLAGISRSSSALRSELSNFNLTSLNISAGELSGKSQSQIAKLLQERFKNNVERILLGIVRITSYSSTSGRILAKASGTVQVLETASGDILMTSQKEKSGMGADNNSAAANAFKEMGKLLGKEVKVNLR